MSSESSDLFRTALFEDTIVADLICSIPLESFETLILV